VSNPSSLTEIVEAVLKELGQAGPQQILSKVKERYPNASRHAVDKILREEGFAERGVGEVTVIRNGRSYKKNGAPIWIYKGQKVTIPPETKPSVEVSIMPRMPRKVVYRVIEEIEQKPPEVIEFQALQVTVRNHQAKNLQAKMFLDDGGVWFDPKWACYLNWGGRRMFDFVANQTDRIEVWLAYRIGDVEKIALNVWSDRPIILPLKEIYQRKNPYISLDIQFIGEDLTDKPRKFTLNAQSWNAIGLTEGRKPIG
jgi:hypothetical protein